MTVNDVAEAMTSSLIEISAENREMYTQTIKEKNICGKVLSMCEIDELKAEFKMVFGDWLLFKNWILMKRSERTLPYEDLSRSGSYRQLKTTSGMLTKPNKLSFTDSLSNIPEITTSEYVDNDDTDAAKGELIDSSRDNETAKEGLLNEEFDQNSESSLNLENDEDENLLSKSKYFQDV